MSDTPLLQVKNLTTSFVTDSGEVHAVNGVSFNLDRGRVLGIVGESGSGKSVTAYSIMRILSDNGRVESGQVLFEGKDILQTPKARCGNSVASASALFSGSHDIFKPGFYRGQPAVGGHPLHTDRTRAQAKARALELLRLVGVNEPDKRLRQYPHQLSGGMRQRVMIAMALACEPDILIADEPTTALDVTTGADIELMRSLQKQLGMAIIMITHDLGVIAEMCDEIIVMYAGRICERGTAEEISNPRHAYTKGLLRSIPRMTDVHENWCPSQARRWICSTCPKGARLRRCDHAMRICLSELPRNCPLTMITWPPAG